VKYIKKNERIALINREKKRAKIDDFIKKFVKVMVNFQKFNK